jgi:hypothetical protein
LFKEIRLTIGELNSNEAFWVAVKDSAEAVTAAFIRTKDTIVEINKLGLLGFFTEGKETKKIQEEYKKDPQAVLDRFVGERIDFGAVGNFIKDLIGVPVRESQGLQGGAGIKKESEVILQGETPKIEILFNKLIGVISDFQSDLRPQFAGGETINVVHSGFIDSNSTFIKDKLKNVAAQNGRIVSNQ